jgi:Mrp family chromosome partitioning ATPase
MNDSPLAPYLVPLRRWWWIVAGVVAVAVALTVLTMPDRDDELAAGASSFQATHLLIRNGESSNQLSYELIALLSQQGDLANRVAASLAGEIDVAAVHSTEVIVDPVTETIAVSATQDSPEVAARLATAYAEELVTYLDERTLSTVENDYQRITERLQEMQESIGNLQNRIDALPIEDSERRILEADLSPLLDEYGLLRNQQRSLAGQREGLAESFVTLEPPSPVPDVGEGSDLLSLPTGPVARLLLAAVLATLFGAGLVLGVDRLDTRVRTRRQAEEAFGLPVIAELPRRSRRHIQRQSLPAYHDPGGVTAEVLRALRLSISLAPTWRLTSLAREESGAVGAKTPFRLDHEPRSIVITSTLTGDGKSTLAANLAVSVAESGKRVLVVDCDFRRPAVGALLEIEPGPGLRELAHLHERPLLDLAAPAVAPNVAMIRSGSRGVTPPWFGSDAAEFVRACTEMADFVIFDTGPITLTNEASALLPHTDTGLIVARAGKVATDQAHGTVERLTQIGASVSGIVLVGSEARRRYGYGYYGGKEGDSNGEIAAEGGPPGRSEPRAAASLWHSNTSETPTPQPADHGSALRGDAAEDLAQVGRSRRPRRGAPR